MAESRVIIKSYSEEDAIRQAALTFKKINSITKIKSGYKPDKCKVIKPGMRVKQNWVTKFYIYTYESKGITPEGAEVYTGLKLEKAVETGRQDAIDEAKALAVKLLKPLTIRMVKVLETGSNVIAEVVPNGGVMGEWEVIGVPYVSSGVMDRKFVENALLQNTQIIPAHKEEQPCSESQDSQESKQPKKVTKRSTKESVSDTATAS